MQITVIFTDVYDGEEHLRTETFDVSPPSTEDASDHYSDWADEQIFPRTGDGTGTSKEACYFATVLTCREYPPLIGVEFVWG